MKNIEVYGNDEDNSMVIKINDLVIFLTAEEAALLDSQMARAYTDFTIRQEEPRGPGQPLDKVRPVRPGTFA